MTFLDRLRVENAVMVYDFWMDLRGVRGRRRRELRRELRTNLRDAAADVGMGTALDRSFSRSPAIRAIRSSSLGHA
ncbi:MAG: hypothetical protein GEU83_04020 [Pseudonocardiaceae bacterium]|nr:hypothetical protein [Pseudonocardiaceae bacterium]